MDGLNRRERTAAGALFLILVRTLVKSFDLIALLILARCLLPQDFGLVAVALSFMQIVEAIVDVPLANVLLPLPRIERGHLNTLFTLCLLRGVVIATVMCVLAWPIAQFYHDERLVGLVCVLSLAPAVRGLSSPRQVELAQALYFAPGGTAEVIGKIAALIASAWVAIATGSYWAIAVGTVTAPVATTLATFVIVPFMPSLSLRNWGLFRGFLGWSMGGQVVGAMNWQCDRVVLAKIVPQAQLGLFTTARDLASTGVMAIIVAISWPAISALAGLVENRERLARAYMQVNSAILSICLPVLCGQALVARELVPLILGRNWIGAVPIFQAVSLALIPVLYSNATSALFYAVGRPELIFSRNLYDFAFRVPVTILLALRFGWVGAVVALGAAEILLGAICCASVRKLLGVPVLHQILGPWRGILSCICMAGAVASLRLVGPVSGGSHSLFLLEAIPLGAMIYVGMHLALWLLSGCPDGVEAAALKLLKRKMPMISFVPAPAKGQS